MTGQTGSAEPPPALSTEGLAVGYRRRRRARPILADLDLAVRPGELTCVLGRNGTGKSTLLRTFANLQPALTGTVKLGGVPVDQMPPLAVASRVAVVLTERIVIGALSARRLVELGRFPHLGWLGRLSADDHRAVDAALHAVEGQHLAGRDCNELSDGERQRIMVARALAQRPAVLVLDEPTAFLDVPGRAEVMNLLRRLAHEQGLAVVVSTHDLELSLRLADILWLVGDDNVTVGTSDDLVGSGQVEKVFFPDRVPAGEDGRVAVGAGWGQAS